MKLVADFPIMATRVQFHVRSCGICGGQSGIGIGFLQVLQFPLPIPTPLTAPQSSSSSSSSRTGTIEQIVAYVQSGLSPHPKKLKKKNAKESYCANIISFCNVLSIRNERY
jgi:hypothetical protein